MQPDHGHSGRGGPGSVFVGRRRELDELLSGLRDALAGQGRLFLIGGHPGIGKSRLADELAASNRSHGARVVWGRCWEAGGAPAYWPWVQAMRGYLRDVDPEILRAQLGPGAPFVAQLIPEIRERVRDLPEPPSLDPETARFRLFDATATFLTRAASGQPLIVILDDLHASDTPSLLLLQFVADAVQDARILTVGAYRDTELGPGHPLLVTLAELSRKPVTRTILLQGLAEPDVTRFIELTTGFTPPAPLVKAIHRQTEGNPLFVGEVVRLLAREGRLEQAAETQTWRLNVPVGLRQVIARRLAHLSAECNRVLILASVLGREFTLDALEQISAVRGDQLLGILDEAASARVVTDVPGAPNRLRFAHALIRDALYDDLTPTRRVRLHRQIGELLETLYAANPEPHLAELAHHFYEAIPSAGVSKAIAYAQAAGDRAVRLLAYEEAVRLYQMAVQAIEMAPSVEPAARCELLLALADARMRAGDMSAAKRTYLTAAEIAGTHRLSEHLARAALGYGGRFVWERAASDTYVIPLLEKALAALGEGDRVLRARLLARLAGALRDQPAREPRASLSAQAVEMARRLGDPATLAYTLDGRFAAIWYPENTDERLAIASELVRAADEAGDKERALQGHHYRLMALLEAGDLSGVYDALEVKRALAEELRQPAQQWYVATVLIMLALFEGRFAEAETELIPHALRLGQRAQSWDAVVAFRLQMFTLRKEQGRLDELEATMTRSVAEYPSYPMFRCMLANFYSGLGRAAEARNIFEGLATDDFGHLPQDNEWLFSVNLLTEVAHFLNDVPRTAALYQRILPFAKLNVVAPAEVIHGSASRGLGLLAAASSRWEEAVRHFEDALATNAALGAHPWVARTRHDYAQALLARGGSGGREQARHLLSAAFQTASELGMTALSAKVATLLAQIGAVPAVPSADAVARVSAVPEPGAPPRATVFRREGEYWSIAYEGDVFRLKDAKGLRYLARLLREPGHEIHAMELVAAEEPGRAELPPGPMRVGELEQHGLHPGLDEPGPILDDEAKAAYRQRLEDLQAEVDEATAWADSERAARAREEMEFLLHELAGAMGLGGRDRRSASAAERARINVTRAVKAALLRIKVHSPALSRHLERTIRTGTFCSYMPDPRLPTAWQV